MELKTPLYDCHVALGGKMVAFGGYSLPVQYPTGVIAEHMAVRKQAGLFDVSHMAELVLKGPDALANAQMLLTNDLSDMADGQVRYSPMCNERGGVVDDMVVYRFRDDCYMMVVNAANHQKDADWVRAHLSGDVQFEDISDQVAQIALQGPQSEAILTKLCPVENHPPNTTPSPTTSRLRAAPACSPAPATPARTALSCTARRRTPSSSGTRCWKPARKMA